MSEVVRPREFASELAKVAGAVLIATTTLSPAAPSAEGASPVLAPAIEAYIPKELKHDKEPVEILK